MRATTVFGTLVLLLMTTASADPGIANPDVDDETRLYVHFAGPETAYLSIQPPPADVTFDETQGVIAHSGCVDAPEGTTTFTEQSHHTVYAVVAPNGIEYDGRLRTYGYGLGDDLLLGNDTMHLTWYIHATDQASTAVDQAAPAFLPNVVVRATLRMGDQLSVGSQAYNSGEIIARAETEPAWLAGDDTDSPSFTYTPVDGKHVYRVDLDLEPQVFDITRQEGFNLRLDAFMDNPLCDDPRAAEGGDYIMPDALRWYSDADHRPSLDLVARNPVRIDRFYGVFEDDGLILKGSYATVWGDADLRSVQLDAPGDVDVLLDPYQCNCSPPHFHTWRWNLTDVDPGTHSLRMAVQTLTGHNATAELRFELGDDRRVLCGRPVGAAEETCQTQVLGKKSPALGIGVMLGLVLLARR